MLFSTLSELTMGGIYLKIGVIFTGGTIGSTIDQSGHIVADKDNRDFLLLNLYRHKFTLQDEFVIRTPYCILSENLSGRELELLVACVNELKEKVDGIIITHGTDTLQYTAAALGYVYSNLAIPIVLVSSNYVLEDSRANGLTNFACAVSFIHAGQGHGVFVRVILLKFIAEQDCKTGFIIRMMF